MQLVYKCDFCTETNIDSTKMTEHEKKCVFAPLLKKCYSCDLHHHDNYGVPYCEIEMDVVNGEENGNCEGWMRE